MLLKQMKHQIFRAFPVVTGRMLRKQRLLATELLIHGVDLVSLIILSAISSTRQTRNRIAIQESLRCIAHQTTEISRNKVTTLPRWQIAQELTALMAFSTQAQILSPDAARANMAHGAQASAFAHKAIERILSANVDGYLIPLRSDQTKVAVSTSYSLS